MLAGRIGNAVLVFAWASTWIFSATAYIANPEVTDGEFRGKAAKLFFGGMWLFAAVALSLGLMTGDVWSGRLETWALAIGCALIYLFVGIVEYFDCVPEDAGL